MTASLLYPVNNGFRRDIKLDGLWKFKFDPKSEGEEFNWQDGLKDTLDMPVPSSFNDFFTKKDEREYTGDFWYETDFFVPEEWENRRVSLRFDAATHRATVYVNGNKIISHEGGFLPFNADLKQAVSFGKNNKVVVKINNELSRTTLPCGDTVTLKNGKKMVRPFFDFYNYSGLNRSVHLIALPDESVEDYSVAYELDGEDAIVRYNVMTNGIHDVSVALYDEDGAKVAGATGRAGGLRVKKAHLWNVLDAYLYQLRIEIVDNDKLLDAYHEEIGIRVVEIKGTEILINQKPVYLKGFGRHEDSDFAGRGFNLNAEKRDFELMKWIGANSFRTSHYPYDEAVYRMADREGFLIIDEVPAVGFKMAAASFLGGLNQSFFDGEWINDLQVNHLAQIKELIRRDKNHASVIAWSLMNEPDTVTDSSVPYFKAVFDATVGLDPQNRPRTFALSEDDTITTSKVLEFPDLYLLNRYPGWYHTWGYEISDGEQNLRDEMDQWKEEGINKPIVFSEFGADTEPGLHKLPSIMWSEEYQVECVQMFNRVFDSYEFIKGEQIWNFADFQTVEGNMRVNGNKKGVFTRQRQPKALAFYLKKRWSDLPLDYKG
ncbi:beta-glucuronidase [Sporolactobacillus shoreicorticis]|uniref:Beta-glucuronidase n=1 Tax=Sporolactobacillus shoreicorticis TaxID=1923877 RepID=A0ABW5S191_9BACL|nr:beta-glucuronidase [Sporolactobacillus shoreicorticis]MCO7124700.1 beta-glucuronidase [Sporolactobacillus shoreicorticis]